MECMKCPSRFWLHEEKREERLIPFFPSDIFSLLVLFHDEVYKLCRNDDFLYKSLAIKVWLDSLMGFCHLKHLFLACTL